MDEQRKIQRRVNILKQQSEVNENDFRNIQELKQGWIKNEIEIQECLGIEDMLDKK